MTVDIARRLQAMIDGGPNDPVDWDAIYEAPDEINTLRKLLRDLLDTSFWYGGSDVSDTPEWKAADEQLSRDAQ